MRRGELVVDQLVRFAVVGDCVVATVVFRQLLFDDVRPDGDAEMIGLAGEVGRDFVVDTIHRESTVADVAPQDSEHPQLMGLFEGCGYFLQLACGSFRAPVHRGTNACGAHFGCLTNRAKHHFVCLVGIREQFVVVDLDDERDAMGEAT